MTDTKDPVLQGRRLRVALRDARKDVGLTQRQVAEALDWSLSKILRIESGESSISTPDLKALLDHYGITDLVQVKELVALARASRRRLWSDYHDVLSREFLIYLGLERSASTIMAYATTTVPGLLQTEDYMRCVVRATSERGASDKTIERRVQARLMRQELLHREGMPDLKFILDEAVLRRRVGGTRVIEHQLVRLKNLAGHPSISIQVLPFAAGEHPGMGGPFTYLELPGPTDGDLVYLERGRNDLVARDAIEETQTQRYLEFFLALQELALPGPDLPCFIEGILAGA